LPRRGSIAMEHQSITGNADLSSVDGGTVELVRSYGPRVVSSADLANAFLGPWSADDEARHARAFTLVCEAEADVLAFLAAERAPTEYALRGCARAALV